MGGMDRIMQRRRKKPNSQSVKSWARYLARYGHAPVNIRNPERYLNSYAQGLIPGGIKISFDDLTDIHA